MGKQNTGKVSSRSAVFDGESIKCLLFSIEGKINGLVPVNGSAISIRQLKEEHYLEVNQVPMMQLAVEDGKIKLKGKLPENWKINTVDHDTYLDLFKSMNETHGGISKI